VLTHWFTPNTGGEVKPLPAGLEFTIMTEPPNKATAVVANPNPPGRWNGFFVNKDDSGDPRYGGYSLVISLDNLKMHCSRL